MTTQLRLVGTEEPADGGKSNSSVARRSTSQGRFTRPIRSAAPVRERLDDHTREIGLVGVSQARAALKDANRRVALRDAQRRAAKERELSRLASHHGGDRLSSRSGPPDVPHDPDGHAAA